MLTRDHVIAESWYPASTPPNQAKWKVDSCRSCNGKLGTVEQELLILIALCLDPQRPASSSIVQKAFDSINPDLAKSGQEKRARLGMKRRIYSHIEEVEKLPEEGVLPSFLENWNRGSRMRVLIPKDYLDTVVGKWVRGLHSLTVKRILPKRAKIEVIHMTEKDAAEVLGPLEPYSVVHLKRPCASVRQWTKSDETRAHSIYEFVVWEQYKVFATVDERFRGKTTS
jgi:hypothetical protein